MLWLPSLKSPSGGSIDLPLAAGSGLAIVEALLAESPERAGPASLVSALELDPGLALWTLIRARLGGHLIECSASSLAQWLCAHGLPWLQWPATDSGESAQRPGDPADLDERVQSLAAAAIARARLARDLAEGLAEDLAENDAMDRPGQAYLAGLLMDAPRWLRLPDGGDPAAEREVELSALAGCDHPAAPRAQRVLQGEEPAPAGTDLEALRQSAAGAAARHFGQPLAGAVWLPALTARLARLKLLEEQFCQQLELEKLESMAEFAAGAGHEINNPLAVIAGRAQLLLRDERRPERRRDLALMNGQAMRVHEMIADMMLFARPPQPRLVPCDLASLIGQVVDSLKDKAQAGQTQLEFLPPDRPLIVQADDRQLSVAVRACLDNALRAAAGGATRIGADLMESVAPAGEKAPPTDEARIWIEDNGPGIPPEVRRHLFDPYYSGRQSGRGLGLGLAKCWRIVTNHGGRIDVQSDPGAWTRVTIYLPRASAQ